MSHPEAAGGSDPAELDTDPGFNKNINSNLVQTRRSSRPASRRSCGREDVQSDVVLHLVSLQLLLVQRRQRSRPVLRRHRRRVRR